EAGKDGRRPRGKVGSRRGEVEAAGLDFPPAAGIADPDPAGARPVLASRDLAAGPGRTDLRREIHPVLAVRPRPHRPGTGGAETEAMGAPRRAPTARGRTGIRGRFGAGFPDRGEDLGI